VGPPRGQHEASGRSQSHRRDAGRPGAARSPAWSSDGVTCDDIHTSQGSSPLIPTSQNRRQVSATVIHVAARSIAAQGLSIFGDRLATLMGLPITSSPCWLHAPVQEAARLCPDRSGPHRLNPGSRSFTSSMDSELPFTKCRQSPRGGRRSCTPATDDKTIVRIERAGCRPIIAAPPSPDVYFQGRGPLNPFCLMPCDSRSERHVDHGSATTYRAAVSFV